MKKVFIAVLAVAALASCVKDEVINPQTAINFGDAYVENSTKAIYEGKTKVDAFKVWGTVTGEGEAVALYEGANVTRGGKDYGDAWSCDVARFWTTNCDYNFYAVVDANEVNAENGVPTTIEYTALGNNDLLYGATVKTTRTDLAQPATPLVAFTMQHLLSKISFKFTNPAANVDYSYNVTSVTVNGAYASGVYTITHAEGNIDGTYAGTWVGTGAMATPLSFGAVSGTLASGAQGAAANSCVIIPGDPALTINVEVETVFGGKVINTKTHELTVNGTDGKNQIEFAKNTHYNFAVTLPTAGNPISFTIGTVGSFGDPIEKPIQ